MTTWKKLINSGSNAHVASLNISDTPSDVSSSIQDGSVFFSALPAQPIPNNLPVGTLMKSITPAVDGGLSRYVMISNNFVATTGEDFVIPSNGTEADINQDGTVSTADLLFFLINFGIVGENLVGDFNGDGVVSTDDLLVFLGAFGTNLYDSFGTYGVGSDTRPFIDWGDAQYNYIQVVDPDEGDNITHSWVNDDGYATLDSVTTLYNTIVQYEDDDYFWDTFLPNGEVVGTSVKLYITQMEALTSPLFEVFIYIYFSQISGTGFISGDFSGGEQTPIEGGHDVWNRTGIPWGESYPTDNSPIGYGPY